MLSPRASKILCSFVQRKFYVAFSCKKKFCVFFHCTMCVIIFFIVQLVQRFSHLIETKQLFSDRQKQLNACAFSDGVEKQKCCVEPGAIKTVITLLYNFLIQNLAGCFVTAIATVSVVFTFCHCWNRCNTFSKSKTDNPTLFQGVFSLQLKWKNYLISIFINYTIRLTFLCRIWVSIVQGFPSRAFLKQRLPH